LIRKSIILKLYYFIFPSHLGGLHNSGENLGGHPALSANPQANMAGEPTGRAVLVPHAQNHRQPGAGRPGHVGSVQQLDGVRQAGVQERQVRAYLPDRHPGLPDASAGGLCERPAPEYTRHPQTSEQVQ